MWSTVNQYLPFVSTDVGEPNIERADLVPPGTDVSVLASAEYTPVRRWPVAS